MTPLKLIALSFLCAALILGSIAESQDANSQTVWSAERRAQPANTSTNYEPSTIVLSGPILDNSGRIEIKKRAIQLFPFDLMFDNMFNSSQGIAPEDAQFALSELARLTSGRVSINQGRIISISGQAATGHRVEDVASEIRNRVPVRLTVGTITIDPPFVGNYVWSVSRQPNSISLDGFVPSEEAKKIIFTNAATIFPNLTIADQTVVADGAPSNFVAATKVGLSQLQYVDFGSAGLSDKKYSVAIGNNTNGGAFTTAMLEALKRTATTSLPNGFEANNFNTTTTLNTDPGSVDFLFATDRKREDNGLDTNFGPARSTSLTFGAVRVHVPDGHHIGSIELPEQHVFLGIKLGKDDFDPKKHFIITEKKVLDIDSWRKILSGHSDEALIFVHGYNTSFDDSVYRFAQIIYDLQYKGHAILFSWPSMGNVLSYEWDRNSSLFARAHFIELLNMLERDVGIKKVHILAHSMGNFLALDALSEYARNPTPPNISQLIMAAPDIDADQYTQDVTNISSIVSGMTLYASQNDAAIKLSHTLAQGKRAADIENGTPMITAGVDAIDVSAIGSEVLGVKDHNMFAENRSLIDDISLVLQGKRPPRLAQIRGVPRNANPPTFWEYAP
jgi:esterase/lipase superfamily enzyme